MNTKSMVLILNGLLLFNTVSHGFSMSSWRKKAVEMCTKIGKKSLSVVCGMIFALLTALNVKAAESLEFFTAQFLRATGRDFHHVPPMLRSSRRHDRGQDNPPQHQEYVEIPRHVPFAYAVADAGRSVARRFNTLDLTERTQQKDRRRAELEEAIERRKQRLEQIEKQKQETIEKFEYVLDDIRNHNYLLSYLPPQLSGTGGDRNMLEHVPKVIVQQILQFIFYGHLYHERSFYVPLHYSELELLKGQKSRLEFWQRSTLNFIDGDPERLELDTCVPLPEDSETNDRYKHVDSIIIDTTTCNYTIKRKEQDDKGRIEAASSYQQRAIGGELYSTTNPEFLPLIQQLNFIGNYDFTWIRWREDNDFGFNSRYHTSGYGGTRKSGKPPYTRPFKYGLQRNLKNGKMVWVRPKGEYVGIYEKAQRWFDKDTAPQHPAFENESVIHDRTGDEFHLVQVIQEETPVCSISLPHTPVYLKDNDGNEIRRCLEYPPDDATAHLRSPLDYPDRPDAMALGFDQTKTNNRCSLYKQLQEKLSEYHPDLLIHQRNALTPTQRATYRKTTLYHGEKVKMPYSTGELAIIAARRIIERPITALTGYSSFPPLE